MTLAVVIAATLFLAGAAGWRWRSAGWLPLGLALPALFCTMLLVAYSIAFAQSDSWSFIRLAPSIAQSRGTPLYHPDGQGPLLGWSYGPVMPLVNLPLGLLSDPSAALIGSALINAVLLLLPLLLAIGSALPPDPKSRVTGILILAALHAILMHVVPSLYWLRRIQVDAFAMGLWLLGIVLLLRADSGRPVSPRRLWAAAVCVVASAFSKHNELVLAAIPCVYLWIRDGRLSALRMALALAVLGFGGVLLCVLAWGWEAVFLNLWLVPARHPWSESGAAGLWSALEFFLDGSRGFLGLFAALAVADFWLGPRGKNLRDLIADRPWLLPAAAALLIFPVSLVGRNKVGGDDNSFHSVYFMAAAIGMIAARWTTDAKPAALGMSIPIVAVLVAVTGTAFYRQGPQSLDAQFAGSLLRREYRFSREHPGEVWFGADPLVTLYSDGKVYHQGYGVFDRTLPNFPPTPRHLREHLPARLRWVSTPPPPFWRPEGLVPIRAPEGLGDQLWFERKPGS